MSRIASIISIIGICLLSAASIAAPAFAGGSDQAKHGSYDAALVPLTPLVFPSVDAVRPLLPLVDTATQVSVIAAFGAVAFFSVKRLGASREPGSASAALPLNRRYDKLGRRT